MMVLEVIAGILTALGGLFFLTSAVGLMRFPDVYSRMHAAGIADAMGALLTTAGLILFSFIPEEGQQVGVPELLLAVKLVFILFFLWVSGTTATHALAKSAWLSGLKPWSKEDGQ